jgi:hypothetical protein
MGALSAYFHAGARTVSQPPVPGFSAIIYGRDLASHCHVAHCEPSVRLSGLICHVTGSSDNRRFTGAEGTMRWGFSPHPRGSTGERSKALQGEVLLLATGTVCNNCQ